MTDYLALADRLDRVVLATDSPEEDTRTVVEAVQALRTLHAVREWAEKPAGDKAGEGGPGPLFTAGLLMQFEADKQQVLALLSSPEGAGR